jgi:hypothetical protein
VTYTGKAREEFNAKRRKPPHLKLKTGPK